MSSLPFASRPYYIFLPISSGEDNGMRFIRDMEIASRVAPIQKPVMEIKLHACELSKRGILVAYNNIDVLPVSFMIIYPIIEWVEIPVLDDILIIPDCYNR